MRTFGSCSREQSRPWRRAVEQAATRQECSLRTRTTSCWGQATARCASGRRNDVLTPAFLDAARALIGANSVTDRGNLPAVRVLQSQCAAEGLKTQVLP